MSMIWKKPETTQYAITGKARARCLSFIPGSSDGSGWSSYDGRGGRSKASVVLDVIVYHALRSLGFGCKVGSGKDNGRVATRYKLVRIGIGEPMYRSTLRGCLRGRTGKQKERIAVGFDSQDQ